MRRPRTHAALAVALTLTACGAKSAPPSEPPATPSTSPSSTGPLSEAEFKALHELRTDQSPPRTGESIELAGGRAYLSLPEGATGPVPGIVVIHEWWGLNPHIEHWADRLASAGYAALAVDLYSGKVATTPDEAMASMKAVDDKAAATTIAAALELLASDPRIQAPKTGVIGWCFGGGWSLQTAIAHPGLDAAVIYYGHLESDPAVLGPIKAALLGIFGTRDTGIPPADVDAFDAALTTAGVAHALHRYDADHAFANPSGPRYDEPDAADAWSKVLAFLEQHLK
jgi:carboxymethylenebutenolidase